VCVAGRYEQKGRERKKNKIKLDHKIMNDAGAEPGAVAAYGQRNFE
jgi:hypothetical protein